MKAIIIKDTERGMRLNNTRFIHHLVQSHIPRFHNQNQYYSRGDKRHYNDSEF